MPALSPALLSRPNNCPRTAHLKSGEHPTQYEDVDEVTAEWTDVGDERARRCTKKGVAPR
jgi:hypothetical protein